MLRVRSFGLAVGASLLFFAGFGAMLLSGVLFLTSVWHESVLTAGLMLFPGPAMATAFSVPSARLGARFGYRAAGRARRADVRRAARSGSSRARAIAPAFLSEYLPGSMIGGAGVGLVIPTLTGAGASSLAPERFATGAAVLTMGRQIGARSAWRCSWPCSARQRASAADFHAAWLITVVGGLAAGLALAAIGPPARAGAAAGRRDLRADRRSADRRAAGRGGGGMSAIAGEEHDARGERTFTWEDPAATAAPGASSRVSSTSADRRRDDAAAADRRGCSGFEIVEAEHGRAVFAMEPAEWMYNPIGMVHGGVAATILDSCMGCAVHTTLAAGVGYTTSDLQVRYIRAMSKDSGRVLAEGRVVHAAGARRPPRALFRG